MALLVFEGFDGTAAAADLFAGVLLNANATASSLFGPDPTTQFGGKSLGVTTLDASGAASAAYATLYATPSSSTVTVGAAINLSGSPTGGYDIGVTNGLACQTFCRFILNRVTVYRGDPVQGAVPIASGLSGLASNGWGYVEVKATVGTGSSGAVSLSVNGAAILGFTGLNTSNDGTSAINGCVLGVCDGSAGTGFRGCIDDVYMLDDSGPPPCNAPLGPTRVLMRAPSANSGVSFTPSGNTNWQQVNDASLDGDASCNYASSVSATDLFAASPLPATTSQVFAVQVKSAARKDDAGQRAMATAITSQGSIQAGSAVALSPAYQYINDIYLNDPHSGGSWTVAGVNQSTFGYTIVR